MSIQRLSPGVSLFEQGRFTPPSPSEEREGSATRAPHLWLAQRASDAFGDGSHPTTRLCAGAVDWICRQRRPGRVLDVGTGTGVLARIARARGVAQVVATDIDPVALSAARANFELDLADVPGFAPSRVELGDRLPDAWGIAFDLVVANILEGPLRELAPSLSASLAPGATLLLSGFTPLQCPGLRIAFERRGLACVGEYGLDGWALLEIRRD